MYIRESEQLGTVRARRASTARTTCTKHWGASGISLSIHFIYFPPDLSYIPVLTVWIPVKTYAMDTVACPLHISQDFCSSRACMRGRLTAGENQCYGWKGTCLPFAKYLNLNVLCVRTSGTEGCGTIAGPWTICRGYRGEVREWERRHMRVDYIYIWEVRHGMKAHFIHCMHAAQEHACTVASERCMHACAVLLCNRVSSAPHPSSCSLSSFLWSGEYIDDW